jgi:putative Mg2+ transporter-C (MgtC) family protein
MAAQIVSGIGFIGGGVIFVRKDLVRGLTTATTIWVTSAVGMACGAGLPLLAIAVTAAHFIVIFGFMSIERHLPKSRWSPTSLQVSYPDGRGILRDILTACTQQDFAVTDVQVERDGEFGRDRRGKQSGKSRRGRRLTRPRQFSNRRTRRTPRRRGWSRSFSSCAAAGRSRGSWTS